MDQDLFYLIPMINQTQLNTFQKMIKLISSLQKNFYLNISPAIKFEKESSTQDAGSNNKEGSRIEGSC